VEKEVVMNIKIIGVGKLKEKYFKDGIAEYAKRLGRFTKFQIVEVPDEKAPESLSSSEMETVKQKEGERILSKIKDKEYVFALAIEGKERSSEEFSKELTQLATYGHSDITFVIGGSLGLDAAVMKRSNAQISFGRFTLPHQLMRLVLTEQIYRAFMINEGSPYHK
jgi:23S rRNA (pseudouridine1915-N3)-methyltransferase